jgi:hypothetical protein
MVAGPVLQQPGAILVVLVDAGLIVSGMLLLVTGG